MRFSTFLYDSRSCGNWTDDKEGCNSLLDGATCLGIFSRFNGTIPEENWHSVFYGQHATGRATGKIKHGMHRKCKLRRPVEKNGLESSLYLSNATPFLFLSPLFSPFPTLSRGAIVPSTCKYYYPEEWRWGIARHAPSLFNLFHAVQVSWTCEYFHVRFRWTPRVTFDFEEFHEAEWSRTKEGFTYIVFAAAIHCRIFMFKRSNLYGEQVVLLITN